MGCMVVYMQNLLYLRTLYPYYAYACFCTPSASLSLSALPINIEKQQLAVHDVSFGATRTSTENLGSSRWEPTLRPSDYLSDTLTTEPLDPQRRGNTSADKLHKLYTSADVSHVL